MDDQPISTIPMETAHNSSFLKKYKFTVISLCVILIALIPLVIISKNSKKPTPPTTQPIAVVSPTPAPLTQANVGPTLSAADTQIQSAIDQSNQDLNQVSQIDTSQDSVAGL